MRIGSQGGFSIVELLVAMAIGLVLTGGIYQLFLGSTTSYSFNEDLSRLQENGRFAMHVMRNEVRGAGYLGCLQDAEALSNTLTSATSFLYSYKNAVYGLEAASGGWEDNSGTVTPTATGTDNLAITSPVVGSDILVIRDVDPDMSSVLTADMDTSVDYGLTAETGLDLATGDILLVANCQAAAVFQATGYNSGTGKISNTSDLGFEFGSGSQVFLPRTVIYYIRNNSDGEPCLYRKINQGAVEELVEGVANMQVLYGLDTNGDYAADIYEPADDVSDWMQVVSVRVGLVMQTVDEVLRGPLDTATYNVDGEGGADFDPTDDRRMRMVVGGTIGLRNRLH